MEDSSLRLKELSSSGLGGRIILPRNSDAFFSIFFSVVLIFFSRYNFPFGLLFQTFVRLIIRPGVKASYLLFSLDQFVVHHDFPLVLSCRSHVLLASLAGRFY